MRIFTLRTIGLLFALSTLFFAPQVMAATLHIDEGFLGHSVNLELFDGAVRISWDAGDVLAPGDLIVTQTSSTQIDIEWSSSYVVGPRGILVGFQVPSSTSPFDVSMLETMQPFGTWKSSATMTAKGFAMTRIGAEGSVRMVTSPKGLRQGTATWYRYKKCSCAASPDFPKGTSLKVSLAEHPEKSIVVKVNDYGPDRNLFPNRVIDLDSTAFIKLSPLAAGMLHVTVEPL